MPRRTAALSVVLVPALVVLTSLGASGPTVRTAPETVHGGDPGAGALVWVSSGCGACHRFRRASSTGKTGPDLDRWLVPHALRARMPVERFVLSRLTWGGRGMRSYRGELTSQEIEDLVAYVTGRPYTAPVGDVPPAPQFTVPPLRTAGPRDVARWTKLARLPDRAQRGARLFAREGCLSCHTYLGSGSSSEGARSLTRAGTRPRTSAFLRRYLARPYAYRNVLMPSFADLGDSNLKALAEFLKASKGRAR